MSSGWSCGCLFFFFNDTATTEIYTLSLHDALPIPIVLKYIPNASVTAILLAIVRWPLLLALAATALAIVYRWGPCRALRWRWIWLSAAAAALVWLAVSALFSWYVASFGSYNRTYGSLGAIFGVMTWMWLSMVVILIGAKLDAELERGPAPEPAGGTTNINQGSALAGYRPRSR